MILSVHSGCSGSLPAACASGSAAYDGGLASVYMMTTTRRCLVSAFEPQHASLTAGIRRAEMNCCDKTPAVSLRALVYS